MTPSHIANHHGVPTLFIDGQPEAAMAYMTYFTEDGHYRQFREAGYRLFSVSVFFSDQGINATTGIRPFSPGIFREKGKADFSVFDRQMEHILAEVPDALIFPRVNTSMPRWWEAENPEECNDTGCYGKPPRSCFASRKWLEQTLSMLGQFLDHAIQSPYSSHICGWQLAGGNTEEWLSFDQNGNTGRRAREEFARRNPGNFQEHQFRRFLSEITAETICTLADFAKKKTERKVIIGAFYGYLFETPDWQSANHALRKILECPDIDFLCAPMAYIARKIPGMDWPYMLPLESLKRNGKLFFSEYDTRTCYTRFLADCHPGACPDNEYRMSIWLGPDSEAETLEHLRMNFCRQVVSGCGSWWFDMFGGWYDSPVLMKQMAEFRKLMDLFLNDPHRESIAECSAWIDEQCFSGLEHPEDFQCCKTGRFAIAKSGIPVDFYEIGDFKREIARYRAAVFFVPAPTPALREAQNYCRQHGIPFLEIRGSEEPDAAEIRKFALNSGCFRYCENIGSTIYASRNLLGILAAENGCYHLHLPEKRKCFRLFHPDGPEWTDTLETELKKGEIAAWRLE
ncbi:MAG: hypothetical protein E7055_00980 [Lentisphaerae bacterium]|nr:hypothetical protein [Lentisphaerota bacterium]